MKIQYKVTVIIALFGTVIVTLLSLGYDMQNYRVVRDKEMENIKNISEEIALHVESNLKEKASLALTLSTAPLIKDTLLKSNSEFALLTEKKRKEEIESLNEQWKKSADINDPFIQAHITNSVAEYLSYQQMIMPGTYGEIFLTNRYGVMIATTGKLTTLAHAHKYWWLAAYDNGQGRIFLDDRGFDTSVEGYVLGVVVPIRDGNDIIGILKCNVNIMGPLTDVVQEYNQRHPGNLKIVRTEGLIVAEQDVTPLTTTVNEDLVGTLRQKEKGTTTITGTNGKQLVAFLPIRITMGSEKYGFGGKQESIDHIKGNKGEAWHIVISLPEEEVVKASHKTNLLIIIAGIILTVLTAAVAMLFGKWVAKPIVKLSQTAQGIGEGHLDTRADIFSNDEIGSLSKSLNRMAENLQNTMTYRDELIQEIEKRQKAEKKLQLLATTDELTGAFNRRAFNDYLYTNIGRAKRYKEPLSILLLDIDNFKIINDSHGHDAGDQVLEALVRVVQKFIRQEDIMARWGGEEFTILLPQTDKGAAMQLAERLREKISEHDFPKIGHVTVSIGHTELQVDDTSDLVVKRVDKALYQAKEGGKNIVISW